MEYKVSPCCCSLYQGQLQCFQDQANSKQDLCLFMQEFGIDEVDIG